MKGGFLRWLLDVDVIPADAQDLRLAWEHPLPVWGWVLIVIAVCGLAAWSYTKLSGARAWRCALAAVRVLILLFLVTLLAGPSLELPREHIERDWVLMLVDRSASMSIADAPGSTGDPQQRIARDEQLKRIIDAGAESLSELAADERHHLVWLGFHGGAFALGAGDAQNPDDPDDTSDQFATPEFGDATGQRTRLDAAITQSLERAAARRLSGIVVLSDGRSEDPPSRSTLRKLQGERVPVFVVPIGSREPIGDLALRRVEGPRRAFVGDKVPVSVELDRVGQAAAETGMTVSLIDELSGAVLDQKRVEPGDSADELTLTATPKLTGEVTWVVRVEGDEPDLIPDNNEKPMIIDLIDRPLRVLYVEGYPRWDYHYLKWLMIREKSIESSVMLLSADRDFAQEGNQPITRVPRSPEEFAEFDIIVIGDVPASFFSPEQLAAIRDQVGHRGAGLLWVAGVRNLPSSYANTDMADLLPMRGSLVLPRIDGYVNMQPTPLAERMGVLQLTTDSETGWPRELLDPSYNWSRLWWAQHIEPGLLKPTTEVLATTVEDIGDAPAPLVMQMRYGAGRSIYVATDEIWRWRYGRGDVLPEQFWVQILRMLGRDSISGAGEPIDLTISQRRVEVSQPVRIDVEVLDSGLLDLARASIRAVVETASGEHVAEIELLRQGDDENRYGATFIADTVGELRVRIDDPALAGISQQAFVDVYTPDDELRRPETDHDVLERLATTTGGRVLDADSLQTLPDLLPNRSVRTENPLTESIWDTPAALILGLLLLTFEWIGRKIVRLV